MITHTDSYSFASRSTDSHPTWDGGQGSSFKNYDTQAHQRTSAVTSFVVSRNSGTSVTAKVSRFQDTEGIRSPPFLSKDVNFRNSTQGAPRRLSPFFLVSFFILLSVFDLDEFALIYIRNCIMPT